jgi:hypothetical protein
MAPLAFWLTISAHPAVHRDQALVAIGIVVVREGGGGRDRRRCSGAVIERARRPAGLDHASVDPGVVEFLHRLARSIMADPKSGLRVAAAGTPAGRRRLLGRLARAALDAEQQLVREGRAAAAL